MPGRTLPRHATGTAVLGLRQNLAQSCCWLPYILAFCLSKAAMKYFAGTLSDRYGRKPVLVAGWLAAVPVPLMLIFGPSWGCIVAANVLLGVSQGLTWSTAVIMKMDLVGPRQRGLAMGFNEAAGCLGVTVTALATAIWQRPYVVTGLSSAAVVGSWLPRGGGYDFGCCAGRIVTASMDWPPASPR